MASPNVVVNLKLKRYTLPLALSVLALLVLLLYWHNRPKPVVRQIRLTCYGAAREVGGSCHLLQLDRLRLLLDCGQFYSPSPDDYTPASVRNAQLPFEAQTIDAVLISHVHLDHIGRLPLLYRAGFRGTIHLTAVSAELAPVMLQMVIRYGDFGNESFYYSKRAPRPTDGAPNINATHVAHWNSRCQYLRRIGKRNRVHIVLRRPDLGRHQPPLRLCKKCTELEISAITSRFRAHPYGEEFVVGRGTRAMFLNAGHVPGSAMIIVRAQTQHGNFRIGYTGDLGNAWHPFVPEPSSFSHADVVITESTYGNISRTALNDPYSDFISTLLRAYEESKCIIIPAFVFDRTQKILHVLGYLQNIVRGTAFDVLITSPVAAHIAEIYARMHDNPAIYAGYFRQEFFEAPFLNDVKWRAIGAHEKLECGPGAVIVASSGDGQFAASRALLKRYLDNSNVSIFSVGWSPPNSPMGQVRTLYEEKSPEQQVIFGKDDVVEVRAELFVANGFSSHADRDGIINLLENCRGLRTVVVVHGDESSVLALGQYVARRFPFVHVFTPRLGETIELLPTHR